MKESLSFPVIALDLWSTFIKLVLLNGRKRQSKNQEKPMNTFLVNYAKLNYIITRAIKFSAMVANIYVGKSEDQNYCLAYWFFWQQHLFAE